MDTFSPATYFDPLYYALGGNMRRLQGFVDVVLADFNTINIDGFTWNEDLLDDFTYEQVEKYVGIAPLANVVDPDSPAVPFGREGASLGTGRIPRMKTVEYLNESKIRTLKKLIRRNDITPGQVRDAAGAAIGEILADQAKSFENALSFQRDQMVSKGGIVYDSTNNPYGIALTLSARVPNGNFKTLTGGAKWFTDTTCATEGANCDPIADLKAIVEVARQKGVNNGHFEINNLYLDSVLKHSKVIAAIKERISLAARYSVTTLDAFNRNEQIAALAEVIGKPIVVRPGLASVEYTSGGKRLTRTFETFVKNVIVFVPDGKIGEILTVEPMLIEGGNYAFGLNGKLAFTIDADYAKKCQSYAGELTSLCVPDKPKWMWYLYPNND